VRQRTSYLLPPPLLALNLWNTKISLSTLSWQLPWPKIGKFWGKKSFILLTFSRSLERFHTFVNSQIVFSIAITNHSSKPSWRSTIWLRKTIIWINMCTFSQRRWDWLLTNSSWRVTSQSPSSTCPLPSEFLLTSWTRNSLLSSTKEE